jgi:hypothetical protein
MELSHYSFRIPYMESSLFSAFNFAMLAILSDEIAPL